MTKSCWEVEILSRLESSAVVVEKISPHGWVALFGDRKLVPPEVEYRGSRQVVVSWTSISSWEIGNLFLRAAELMSLSPNYSIRRAFLLWVNKERLVFEVADGVMTPEDGRELVSRIFDDEFFFVQSCIRFWSTWFFESCSGGPILAFIGCKTEG